jgi:hypothetical protein
VSKQALPFALRVFFYVVFDFDIACAACSLLFIIGVTRLAAHVGNGATCSGPGRSARTRSIFFIIKKQPRCAQKTHNYPQRLFARQANDHRRCMAQCSTQMSDSDTNTSAKTHGGHETTRAHNLQSGNTLVFR